MRRNGWHEWIVTWQDPRTLPAYGIAEAAHYLRVPKATVRAWTRGQRYVTATGQPRVFAPVLTLPNRSRPLLSFVNLVEAHVLAAIRREHRISLQRVRAVIRYLSRLIPSPHPLAEQKFETDGVHLFVQHYGHLVNISQEGQLAIRTVLEAHLRRIERDAAGLVARLYPFTRTCDLAAPRAVVIDPDIAFGRPVLTGTGIPTAVVAERYQAGESVDELAEDYGRERGEIEEAIRCELALDAA